MNSKPLEINDVVAELLALDVAYGKSRDYDLHGNCPELLMLARVWLKDLGGYMSAQAFAECVSLARQATTYYPTTADVLRAYREAYRAKPSGAKSLPDGRGPTVPHDRVKKYVANIQAIIGNRALPYPDCVPDPKWRTWQPSAHAGHDTAFASPGQPLSRYESPDYEPKQAVPGSMHDPRPRRHEPEEQEAAGYSDWDEYREMAANG